VVPEAAISRFSPEQRLESCIGVSVEADGYIGSAKTLPLVSWGEDLALHCARMCAALLAMERGADPLANGPDASIFAGQSNALKWLDRLANGRLSPPDMVDSTPETFDGGSVVVSSTKRGW
jgi:hypothetical protein